MADRGGIQGLLLWFRQRRPLAALPHRLHAPHLPGRGLGMLPGRQPQVRRGGSAGSQDRAPGHPCPGLSFRAAAAADPREAARRRSSSPSGTFPGRMPRYSAFARGTRKSSTACSAARSSASTSSSTATISSTAWTVSWNRASTARMPPSPTAATPPSCIPIRSLSNGRKNVGTLSSRRCASASSSSSACPRT